ncbi:MAG: hypothetical protein HS126_27305 [Anaerolineales bacterium]|nr:hypothetical protein [Anaerolineales bacterium]
MKIKINRAPVLTLWAAVVAERLGYDRDAALTLGKGVAGLNAQSKGRRLGIFEESKGDKKEEREPKKRTAGEQYSVTVLGRPVPVVETDDGVRATIKGEAIKPDSVQRYLENKFGDNLAEVQAAMQGLAKAYNASQLARQAYDLYEQFRPAIPEGKKGWGAAGDLDLDYIRSLAKKES